MPDPQITWAPQARLWHPMGAPWIDIPRKIGESQVTDWDMMPIQTNPNQSNLPSPRGMVPRIVVRSPNHVEAVKELRLESSQER